MNQLHQLSPLRLHLTALLLALLLAPLAALHAADVPAKNSDTPVTAAEGALVSVLPHVVSAATPDKPNVLGSSG